MIRRNIVAVLATCAALAVGIALGGGPLRDLGHAESSDSSQSAETSPDLSARAALDERFIGDVGETLLSGKLARQRVAVLAFPGVSDRVLDGTTARVESAHGTVTSVVRIAPSLIDPARKTYLDNLSSQLAKRLSDRVNPALDTYPRFGQVLGAAYASRTPESRFDGAQATAAEALTTAKLVNVTGGRTPATLVLVLLGHEADPTVLSGIVHGIGGEARGVVAAGASSSADLATLRRQGWGSWFASVDGVETAAGQVATALALAGQVTQRGGDFGASGFGGLLSLG